MDLFLEELCASTFMYKFAISKLLLDGWYDWFQILQAVTDHAGDSQHGFTKFPQDFTLRALKVQM